MNIPKLYSRDKMNRIREWSIYTEGDKYIVYHGVQGGKFQKDVVQVVPKNLGKSNETTPDQQAMAEAISKWQKQKDKGYRETIQELDELPFLPMLAHEFEEKRVTYPVLIQREFDGVRCFGEGENLLSRKRKEFYYLDHIRKWTKFIYDEFNVIPDGELYSEEENFETIISKVKQQKKAPENQESIKYMIYDIFPEYDKNMDQFQRAVLLKDIYNKINNIGNNSVVLADTYRASSLDEIDRFHDKFTKEGYEGAIVRNKSGLYVCERSYDLLKYKKFIDEDFKIVGIGEGVGRDKGLAIFELELKYGRTFKARPEGSNENREEIFKNQDKYLGKLANVRFFSYTAYGVPRFPVVTGTRDYE